VTHVRHYRKLFSTEGGESRDIVRDCDRVGGGWVRNAQYRRGGVEGGSKQERKRSGLSANGAGGRFSGIVLGLFWVQSMVGAESSFRKRGGVVRENMQLQSIAFSTTGYVRSTSPYRPHGVPIFPKPPKITKQN